jgi:hypothetical protein
MIFDDPDAWQIYPPQRTTVNECIAFNYVYPAVKIYIQQVETITECPIIDGSDGFINASMSNDSTEVLGNTSAHIDKNIIIICVVCHENYVLSVNTPLPSVPHSPIFCLWKGFVYIPAFLGNVICPTNDTPTNNPACRRP